ncbi:MAG: aspartate 4-decarboxylase [Syntrophorhabdaceae bacterium]|nr:aspartate 4-decarboxylase [Syntrophorhabdaceae bacterium]
MDRETERKYQQLSPFELKDNLISLAAEHTKQSTMAMLNAGRGNPNWIATTPREAFFTLGGFAIEESKRVWNQPHFGGMPQAKGIAKRFNEFAAKNPAAPGIDLLKDAIVYAVGKFGFDADTFVHELTDSVIGDQYPTPDRMLKCIERVVHEYLVQEMCAGQPPEGRYDLFAVEGGTAAMCYVFDSLMVNKLLHKGDKIALGVPTFTPYIEIPELDRYEFRVVEIFADEVDAQGNHTWQYPDWQITRLADPSIKAFFLVNPSNPPSVTLRPNSMNRLVEIVKTRNPNLIIITDDVYGTFVNGFVSLMAKLPRNTIGVYSFSKYFGCTGWRLGVVAVHEDNIFDPMIAKLPEADRNILNNRYKSLSLTPEKMKFIDRMVADSRQVALNHTAGLSLPQQAQMALFSLFALVDKENNYKKATQQIIQRRLEDLIKGIGFTLQPNPYRTGYYATLDLLVWARRMYGEEFADYLTTNYEPVDILFRLAERFSTVLLNGGGFDAPDWSIRISLANLPDETYPLIGEYLAALGKEYVREWEASKNK